eukprot:TRINITY_DN525_c0_g1_i1.p1 TRINITY_DN525_c0_g1~~TRINITY_DN525_c0_g1_i1.p1  ORF type:complete len:251 (+),score=24.49 TRINITY_DN525_c0_g1_i1:583-1335(+)
MSVSSSDSPQEFSESSSKSDKCCAFCSFMVITDWIIVAVGFLICYILLPNLEFIAPYARYIPEVFPRGSYPGVSSIVSGAAQVPVAGFPLILYILYFIFKRDSAELHHSIIGNLKSWIFSQTFIELGKYFSGSPRPNYFAHIAAGEDINDASKSFPSGHTTASFASLIYFTCWLSFQLGLYKKRGGQIWKYLICLIFVYIAFLVGISRNIDYHHHFYDVTCGSIIGTLIAYSCYLQYRASLKKKKRAINP